MDSTMDTKVLPEPSLTQPIWNLPVSDATIPFWHSDLDDLHNHRSSADVPKQSDIVIIGAGYSGIATAWHLIKDKNPDDPYLSITILEARGVCSGATGRNGGHLRPDLYGHIPTYIARAGVTAAAEVAEFELAHVSTIKKLIEEEKIDCDFTLTRTIDVWCSEEGADAAKKVYESMLAHNLRFMDGVAFTYGARAEGISGVKGAKACISYTAGTLWPYKFILQLVNVLLKTGHINLQTNTPVVSVESVDNTTAIVQTMRGPISATKVVYANNGYISGLLPEFDKSIIPCKGICCHIVVPDGHLASLLNNSYVVRSEDNVLCYLAPRADGTIVVGGSSSIFKPFQEQWYRNVDDSTLIEASKDYFNGFMQRTFKGWEDSGAEVSKIWTGVMGYSYDTHPHIGAVPNKPGQFVLAGFHGHGMPVIWLSAKGLATMLRENKPFEETSIPSLFKTNEERIRRAQEGKETDGDILGQSSYFRPQIVKKDCS